MNESQQLLADYVENGSETAFRQLVQRYLDLVYSAAIRLVNGNAHLAEDVTQTVFTDLAQTARKLSPEVMLGGWLHRHTCFVASKTLRGERRRLARERQAVEMRALDDHGDLSQVAPILDDAINQLDAEDRTAILLRFFEQYDFKAVGQALGGSDEAARKRVDRALGKLESLLKRRGITFSASALGVTLAAHAVTAAPAGLSATVSSLALASAVAGGGTAFTLINLMSMTKVKIAVVSVVVAAGVSIPWALQHQTKKELMAANELLASQRQQIEQLAAESARLAGLTARKAEPAPTTNHSASEILQLRGEVGRLRQETAADKAAAAARTNAPSTLAGLTANPEMWKVIRDQQKMGLAMIYKDFAKRAKLGDEQGEKLADLLADDVMENIDRISDFLRHGNPKDMDQMFRVQESALLKKVEDLLGSEAFAQYQEYNRNLCSYITAEQFKALLKGEQADKDVKGKQLYEMLLAETQQTLAQAGLTSDYQTVPTLNFRNFASETEAEKNLALLDGIYDRVTTKASAFLSPDEVAQFGQFRTNAIVGNRMALALNRKMMAPPQ